MNTFIALARYKGDVEDAERLDYKEFSGNLFQQIENCNKYLREHMALMSRLKPGEVKREDIPEYGFFKLLEEYSAWSKLTSLILTSLIDLFSTLLKVAFSLKCCWVLNSSVDLRGEKLSLKIPISANFLFKNKELIISSPREAHSVL